jgi:hypothetical protein
MIEFEERRTTTLRYFDDRPRINWRPQKTDAGR